MRIMILANKDLASNIAVNLLLKSAPQHNYALLLSSKVGARDTIPTQLKELAFFEQTLFNDIVSPLTCKLDNDTNKYVDSFDSLKRKGIEMSVVGQINHTEGIKAVAAFAPNLIVSIRFGQILQQAIIDIPDAGVINLHSGLLPNYRGVMATFWAMLNQESEFGTTLHYIDSSKIDTGGVISVHKAKIDYQKSFLYNVLSLYPQGVTQIIRAIDKIAKGQALHSVPMDIEQGKYYSVPDKLSLDKFAEQGNRLIDYAEITEFAKWYYQAPLYFPKP